MYPVDLHMHTVASTHAYSTLHDYIAEAKRKGIKLSPLPTMVGYGRCSTLLAFRQYAHLAADGRRRWYFTRY